MLHSLCVDLSLGNMLTPSTTAEILYVLADAALDDPDGVAHGITRPANVWQVDVMRAGFSVDDPSLNPRAPVADATCGRRWFAASRKRCLHAARMLLCRNPPPTRQDCLAMIKSRPEVIDKLLDCIVAERDPVLPEIPVDAGGNVISSACPHDSPSS